MMMYSMKSGRDKHTNPREPWSGRSVFSSLRLLNWNNLHKFIRNCRVHGFRDSFTKTAGKLYRSRAINPPTVNPLFLPKPDASYIEESLPLIDRKVSVIIPTKNAGADFPHLLKKLKGQKGLRGIEIVIVDSGSTDETLAIAEKEAAKVVKIPPEAFNHAYSRNTGAEHAQGDYLLFMVQDALPLTDRWIWELANVLEYNDVAAVSCAEYPRSDCDIFYQWNIWSHYKTLNLDKDRILGWDESCDTHIGLRSNSQINSVACLFRKDIFSRYRFRINYAEDLDLGIRLIKDGHKIGFLYSTRVLHSHNRPADYFLKRSYVDTKYLKTVFPDIRFPATDDPGHLFRNIEDLFRKTKQAACFLADPGERNDREPPLVMDRIRGMYSGGYPGTVNKAAGPSEEAFETLILSLPTYFKGRSAVHNSGRNQLLPYFFNLLESLQDYITLGRTNVDASLAGELGTALYKLAALTGGTYLAYLYLTLSGRSDGEEFSVELDETLSSGV
jgi:glycosyltransferase involved in cell wall biosynthesis